MRRKPLSGTLIGILVGVAVAVIIARLGAWPPDQLTIFLLPALSGLLGMTILSLGRENSVATMVISLIILIPMLVWGALGFGLVDQRGELNGGCTVTADSGIDTTTVTDTSRADPFVVDSDGGLSWSAMSPEAFMDYEWELHVDFGGIPVPIDSGTEANTAGDTENAGEVDNVGEYASARGINLDLYRGVYQVGGSAATCDGFGFIEIVGDGIDPVSIVAIVLIVLLLILFLILFFAGRSQPATGSAEVDEQGDDVDVSGVEAPGDAGASNAGEGDDQA